MAITKKFKATLSRFGFTGLLLPALFLTTATLATPADDGKIETIDATAMGTSTQLGKTVSVKIIIQKYSTADDKAALIAAFKAGQNKGLVDALEKSPSVGNIAITGTIGQQLAYISLTKTDTGRRIRFATNRLIKFGEAYRNTQSTAFDLTAGEINLNDSDNKKSGGVLYPASQLIINKDGQLEFQLRRNPWKLVNIIDWNQAGATK
jgi:hypothetical protein